MGGGATILIHGYCKNTGTIGYKPSLPYLLDTKKEAS